MSADKVMDEFDAWWADPAQAELRKSCSKGWAHHVWQASRAALCVDLPRRPAMSMFASVPECRCAQEAHDRVVSAIEESGVRWK